MGSSGGHFFPGLRIAQFLREKYEIETTFSGPIKNEFQTILKSEKFPFIDLKISAGQSNIVSTFVF